MANPSPLSLLDDLVDRLGSSLQPPAWVVQEFHRRIVILANHVLMQEPEAMSRLARQAGRVAHARWRVFDMRLVATPAGLLDLAPAEATPDLVITLAEESASGLAQAMLRGERPPVQISGDVQLAAEINWLTDHVRWDLEEDLARVIGDVPAHQLSKAARGAADALRQFAVRRNPAPAAGSSAPAPVAGRTGA